VVFHTRPHVVLMVLAYLSVLVAVVMAALALHEIRGVRVALTSIAHRPQVADPVPAVERVENNARAIDDLYSDLQQIRLAVSEGINRVSRSDKRIEKTVASARRLLAANGLEHPGLEAESEQLRGEDDDPSPVGELPEVREVVESGSPTGIPGIDSTQLRLLQETLSA